jgi:hypothetical protein
MGTVSTLERESIVATTNQATIVPVKVKNPAMNTNIQSTKLQDVSAFLFNQLIPGEICRFGEGWLTKCPECEKLIFINSEFKTFSIKGKDCWRLAPSLICPNDDCNWHSSIVIEPEEEIEEVEEEEIEEDSSNSTILEEERVIV